MDRFIILQLVLILLTVPLQLFLVTKWSYKNIDSVQTINKYNFSFKYF
jgi:hypothetical protein